MVKLNNKHKQFADEFLSNGQNITKAYRTIYSHVKKDEVAAVNGNRLMNRPEVIEYIQSKQEEMATKAEINREYILNEYLQLLDSCKFEGLDGTGSIKDRTNWAKALAQLTKMLGLDEPDKSEVTHKGININIIKPKKNKE